MKTIFKFLFAFLILFVFSCSQETPPDPLVIEMESAILNGVSAKSSINTTTDIIIPPPLGTPPPDLIVIGTSTLHRNKNGITVNFKANGLHPGAYTIWWVIWNNPLKCASPGACNEGDFNRFADVEVEVMYAGGHVVGKNGKGNFSAHLNVNDASGSINEEFFGLPPFGGLQAGKTFSSEVHVVLRTHGPVVPGLVDEQIGSYGGGCDVPLLNLPFTVYPNVIGECADIAAALFAPVD